MLPAGRLKGGTVINPIYREPKGNYQLFLNAVQAKEGSDLSKESIIMKANKKWREIKTKPEVIDAYVKSVPKPKSTFKQESIFQAFKKSGTSSASKTESGNSEATPDPKVNSKSKPSGSQPFHSANAIDAVTERELFLRSQDKTICQGFLNEVMPERIDEVMSDKHIWGTTIFKQTLLRASRAWNVFSPLLKEYEEKKTFTKATSSFNKALNDLKGEITKFVEQIHKVLDVNVYATLGLSTLSINLSEKEEKLMQAVNSLLTVTSLITDAKTLRVLRQRLRQQKHTQRHSVLHRNDSEIPKMFCLNNCELTWEDAIVSLIELQNGEDKSF